MMANKHQSELTLARTLGLYVQGAVVQEATFTLSTDVISDVYFLNGGVFPVAGGNRLDRPLCDLFDPPSKLRALDLINNQSAATPTPFTIDPLVYDQILSVRPPGLNSDTFRVMDVASFSVVADLNPIILSASAGQLAPNAEPSCCIYLAAVLPTIQPPLLAPPPPLPVPPPLKVMNYGGGLGTATCPASTPFLPYPGRVTLWYRILLNIQDQLPNLVYIPTVRTNTIASGMLRRFLGVSVETPLFPGYGSPLVVVGSPTITFRGTYDPSYQLATSQLLRYNQL